MKPRKMVLLALLVSLALAVNLAEGMLPMPFPGMKLGAANVFALTALVLMGQKEAFFVTILRVFLAWLLTGNAFAFFCSMAGGLLSTAAMALLYTKCGDLFSLPWISVAGAWVFNVGQILIVAALVGDVKVFYYLLPLLPAAAAAGWTVGLLARLLSDRLAVIIDRGKF